MLLSVSAHRNEKSFTQERISINGSLGVRAFYPRLMVVTIVLRFFAMAVHECCKLAEFYIIRYRNGRAGTPWLSYEVSWKLFRGGGQETWMTGFCCGRHVKAIWIEEEGKSWRNVTIERGSCSVVLRICPRPALPVCEEGHGRMPDELRHSVVLLWCWVTIDNSSLRWRGKIRCLPVASCAFGSLL